MGCSSFNEEHKNIGAAYYNLALSYSELKKYDDSASALEKALKWDPHLKAASYNLAIVLAEQGVWEDSEVFLDELLAQDPSNTKILKAQAYLYYKKGDFSHSIDLYNRVLLLNEFDFDVIWNLFILTKDVDEAKANGYLDKLSPFNELSLNQLDKILVFADHVENYLLMEQVAILSLSKDENNFHGLEYLGKAYEGEKLYGKAVDLYSDNIRRADGLFLFLRGRLYILYLGEKDAGWEDIRMAIEKGFKDDELISNLRDKIDDVDVKTFDSILDEHGISLKGDDKTAH